MGDPKNESAPTPAEQAPETRKYNIQHERKGDVVVVRWGMTLENDVTKEQRYGGEGVVTLPIAVFNYCASSDVYED